MKILMLAPEPFFTPRGTPFSILCRLKGLSRLGHQVDLVTYHLGGDVEIPGCRIHRIPGMPFIRSVRIGPSFAKIPLDAVLFAKAAEMFLQKGYDCVHTHEEAAVAGAVLRKIFGVPHLYDMHSSLPEQMTNYNFLKSFPNLCPGIAGIFERFILSNADAVIAICHHLKEIALSSGARGTVEVIENTAPLEESPEPGPEDVRRFREEIGAGKKVIALYAGTFEFNQGLEEIVRCIPLVLQKFQAITFLFVGGERHQIEALRKLAATLGVEDHIVFTGKRPAGEMPLYTAACDILLSFRKIGTNVPLKIYSYLRSGKPIVATNLYVHTQVLIAGTAVLTEPTPEEFARGIAALAMDTEMRERIGQSALRHAELNYTYEIYLAKLKKVFDEIQTRSRKRGMSR